MFGEFMMYASHQENFCLCKRATWIITTVAGGEKRDRDCECGYCLPVARGVRNREIFL